MRNSSTKVTWLAAIVALFVFGPATPGSADLLFSDDFESGSFAAYTGAGGGGHNGVNVLDPIEGDRALNFSALNSAGDLFTIATFSHPSNQYFLEFDYLGDPNQGGNPNNLGGFIGHSMALPGGHTWLGGTGSFPTPVDLPDTGVWEHVIIPFNTLSAFHLMLEDFVGSGGVAGDAYFDNLKLHGGSIAAVPEPTSLLAWAVLGGALAFRSRRRRIM